METCQKTDLLVIDTDQLNIYKGRFLLTACIQTGRSRRTVPVLQ